MCAVGPCVVVECRLTVTRMLFGQENSCHRSGCPHVRASAALGSRVLSEGVLKRVGVDGMGFVKFQSAYTQGRLGMSINASPCTGQGALQGANA